LQRRLAGLMAVTALVIGPTVARPAVAEVEEPSGADLPAALEAGEEVVEERTESSKTFVTDAPGVNRTEVYTQPVHYESASGDWLEVDPGVTEAADGSFASDGTGTPVEADGVTEGASDLGDGVSAAFELASDDATRVGEAGIEVSGVDEGVDVELEVTATGLKETIVLASPAAPRRFEFPLELSGATARLEESGSVALVDGEGDVAGVIPAGWMEDSAAHPVTGVAAESTGVQYSLEGSGATPTLVVTLDDAWLDDPERVYPVLVDPSFTQADAGLDDTYVMAYSAGDRSTLTQLQVGNNGFLGTRSFIKFPDIDLLAGKQIHHAELKLYQYGTGSCTPTPMDIYTVGSAWTGSTVTTWGGPASTGSPVATITAAHGATGCPADWERIGVTDLVTSWAGGLANHGITLRARNESDAAQFKRFGSGDSWTPPHIQVIWSDEELQPPEVTLETGPATDTLQPTISALYWDDLNRPGEVNFLLLDEAGRAVDGGTVATASRQTVSWRVSEDVLEPEMTYSVVAFAENDAGVHSVNTPLAVDVTVDDLAFATLSDGDVEFSTVDVPVAAGAGLSLDRVDLLVDNVVVGTDTSPPYSFAWDTTAAADGSHAVVARGVDGTTTVAEADVDIKVWNASTGPQRARFDRDRGRLTVDESALITVQSALDDPATPARYQSETISGSTYDIVAPLTEVGIDLSTQTKDAIAALLEPKTEELEPEGFAISSGTPEPIGPLCPERLRAWINRVEPDPMCVYRHQPSNPDLPEMNFYYTLTSRPGTGYTGGDLEGALAADADNNDIVDAVDTAIENMEIAAEEYLDMGYELSSEVMDKGLTVAFHAKPGYANPWKKGGLPSRWAHPMTFDTREDLDGIAYLSRHELFHVFEYSYMNIVDVAGDVCPAELTANLCPRGGFWWIEAAAEWATHQVEEEWDLTHPPLAGANRYDDNLDAFAATPDWGLMSHSPFAPDDDLLGDRGYGAFIFLESMQERYGDDIILSIFEKLDDNPLNPANERDITEAFEAALDEENVELHDELFNMWISFYLLADDTQVDVLGFADDDLAQWRVDLDNSTLDGIAGESGFISTARVDRATDPVIASVGFSEEIDELVGIGGANFVELGSTQAFRDENRTVSIRAQVNPDRSQKVSFTLLRLHKDGFPNVCPSAPGEVPDENGQVYMSWEPTENCRRAAIVVNHLDPNSTYFLGGDMYSLNLFHSTET
jgi:hypothetical protein